jgi:hypothetical protein
MPKEWKSASKKQCSIGKQSGKQEGRVGRGGKMHRSTLAPWRSLIENGLRKFGKKGGELVRIW